MPNSVRAWPGSTARWAHRASIEVPAGIAIGAALALNAFSPAPSRVIVCSIGALAATVRLQCRQLRLHYCDRIGNAMAQYVLGTDRRGIAIDHVREFQRMARQSNTRPSSVPSATTNAIRSSAGRLKATSNGTPFRTR